MYWKTPRGDFGVTHNHDRSKILLGITDNNSEQQVKTALTPLQACQLTAELCRLIQFWFRDKAGKETR